MREFTEESRAGSRHEAAEGGVGDAAMPAAPGIAESEFQQPVLPKAAADGAAPASRRARLDAWWAAASPNLKGSIFTITAFIFFTIMVTLVKLLGQRLPLSQILIVRQIIITLVLLAIFRGATIPALKTSRFNLQVLRTALMLGAMFFGFTAVVHMPVAEASSLSFSQVLWVTLAAIVILGEKVDARRWLAMAIGFCGILIMLRPGLQAFNPYAAFAIVGAMMGAGITITVRKLGETERTETILLWQCVLLISVLAVPAFMQWQTPTPEEWLQLGLLGISGVGGQWLITRGHQLGEASAMAPLDFVRLLLATIAGYVVFLEVPDAVTILGASLVVGGTILTVSHNARRQAEPLP